jgi:hypothetical protein
MERRHIKLDVSLSITAYYGGEGWSEYLSRMSKRNYRGAISLSKVV